MHIGALVVKKLRWGVNSQLIGLIVSKSKDKDVWLVLWTLGDKKYKIQEHLEDALLDLHCMHDVEISKRPLITM